MTILTQSWMWVSSGTWPGYSRYDSDNLDAIGNGLAISPSGYTEVTLSDSHGDGLISDTDRDDGSTWTCDKVIIGDDSHSVREVAAYTGSSITIDGTTYANLTFAVTLFDDGTYGVRLLDSQIPEGEHFQNVTQVKLGTFNGVEYSAVSVAGIDGAFVCFASGTLIDAADGPRPVERLRPGDAVATLDHGAQTLRWVGSKTVSGRGRMAPVCFAAGAMGNAHPVLVSPQHRVLLAHTQAELLFGAAQVLAPARHLVNGTSIRRAPCDAVTYVHLLFDRHEIIGASGLMSESFHPGTYGLNLLDAATRAEVLELFPKLWRSPAGYGPTARRCLRSWETRLLLAA